MKMSWALMAALGLTSAASLSYAVSVGGVDRQQLRQGPDDFCNVLDNCTLPDDCSPFGVEADEMGRNWLWASGNGCTAGLSDRLFAIEAPDTAFGTLPGKDADGRCASVFECDVSDPASDYVIGFTTVDGMSSLVNGNILVADWGGDGAAYDDTIREFAINEESCDCVYEWIFDDSGTENGVNHCSPLIGNDCEAISGPFPLTGVEDIDVISDDGTNITINLVEDITATVWEMVLTRDGSGCNGEAGDTVSTWAFQNAFIVETPMGGVNVGEMHNFTGDFSAFNAVWERDVTFSTISSCTSPQGFQGGLTEFDNSVLGLGGFSFTATTSEVVIAEGPDYQPPPCDIAMEASTLARCPGSNVQYRITGSNDSGANATVEVTLIIPAVVPISTDIAAPGSYEFRPNLQLPSNEPDCTKVGTLSTTAEIVCSGISGTTSADTTLVSERDAPQALGACCFSSGTCTIQTSTGCTSSGGIYQGNNVSCPDANCPQPTGACCFGDGSCEVDTAVGCLLGSGTYQGNGVSCSQANCPQPPDPAGACYAPAGDCSIETQAFCEAADGSYCGDGSVCSNEHLCEPDRAAADMTIPACYDPETPAPLVVLLHGYGWTSSRIESYLQLGPLAEELCYLLAVPNGVPASSGCSSCDTQFWNPLERCCCDGNCSDDDAYLLSIIDSMKQQYNVNSTQVYVVGHSNGAAMAHGMACRHADVIAGIAGIGGPWSDDLGDCAPSEPVHVLHVHGTSDETIAFEGGCLTDHPLDGSCQGESCCYHSASDLVEQWAGLVGCDSVQPQGQMLDLDESLPGAETSVSAAELCPPSGSATLWSIVGGKHSPEFSEDAVRLMIEHLLARPKADSSSDQR